MPDKLNLSDKSPAEIFYAAIFKELPKCDLEETDIQELLNVLDTLMRREADITRRCFGLGAINDDPEPGLGAASETMEQIAEDYKVPVERIRRIRDKALRKLHHSDRAQKIQALFRPRAELRAQIFELSEENDALKREIEMLNFKLSRANEALNQQLNIDTDTVKAVEDPHKWKIDSLSFSARTYNALNRHGIKSLGDIAALSREDVQDIRNLGRKSFEEVEAKLESFGLSFKKETRFRRD